MATSSVEDIPVVPSNASFDPFTQTFMIKLQDGTSEIITSVLEINELRSLAVNQAITRATQLGAAAVLLAAIFLMTRAEKRRSSVFCLNIISLLLVVMRSAFQLGTMNGPLYEFWRWKTYTYVLMGNSAEISACAEAFSLLLTVAVLVSLFVQVRIVCCNLSDARRNIINASNGITIALAVGMRLALAVLNIRWNILNVGEGSFDEFDTLGRMASAANITLVISIAFSTVIFTGKLAAAILARRSMGMTRFGPMQIIFIMGCQTMFTPLIFTIVSYTCTKNTNIQSFVPVIVAISLPLSGMWATVNSESVHIANPDPRKHRVVFGASSYGSKNTGGSGGAGSSKGLSTASTYCDDDKVGLTSPSPKKSGGRYSEPDLEMQKLGKGVNVERTYSVRSD